jgi:hypothetical protein
MPTGGIFPVADTVSNLLQVLERDERATMTFGLCTRFLRALMDVITAPASESVTDALERVMDPVRSCLLKAGTAFLEVPALMIEIVGVADEPSCAGHSDMVIDVVVHAKDVRILGFLRTACVDFPFHHGVEGDSSASLS